MLPSLNLLFGIGHGTSAILGLALGLPAIPFQGNTY